MGRDDVVVSWGLIAHLGIGIYNRSVNCWKVLPSSAGASSEAAIEAPRISTSDGEPTLTAILTAKTIDNSRS